MGRIQHKKGTGSQDNSHSKNSTVNDDIFLFIFSKIRASGKGHLLSGFFGCRGISRGSKKKIPSKKKN